MILGWVSSPMNLLRYKWGLKSLDFHKLLHDSGDPSGTRTTLRLVLVQIEIQQFLKDLAFLLAQHTCTYKNGHRFLRGRLEYRQCPPCYFGRVLPQEYLASSLFSGVSLQNWLRQGMNWLKIYRSIVAIQ